MRRDIDDIALSTHMSLSGSHHQLPLTDGGRAGHLQQPLTGYGRKEIDDMVSGTIYYQHYCLSVPFSILLICANYFHLILQHSYSKHR